MVPSSFDGTPIAFEVWGVGSPTIVFVPGLTGDRSDFSAQVSFFEGSHQVVGVDLPGNGESGRDRSVWTMAAFGQDVATVVDHLALDDLVLVGHSLGGDAIVEAALRLGGRVRDLFGSAATGPSARSWMKIRSTGGWLRSGKTSSQLWTI
jgi:pimeloyl-ACP methyl ester carboxylesterase